MLVSIIDFLFKGYQECGSVTYFQHRKEIENSDATEKSCSAMNKYYYCCVGAYTKYYYYYVGAYRKHSKPDVNERKKTNKKDRDVAG